MSPICPDKPASDSDSEASDAEASENVGFMADNLEELKAAFRNLYKKVHNNMDNYNKLVLILDELNCLTIVCVNCLTNEECNGIKMNIQKKIGTP